MRGLITLDIDGTLTASLGKIPEAVMTYLAKIFESGWEIAFITGRSFSVTWPALKVLPFPFHIAVQNGALLFQMPEGKIVERRQVCRSNFAAIEEICTKYQTDYAVFNFSQGKDEIYYRPGRHRELMRSYLAKRACTFGENWIPVECYNALDLADISSLKVIGDRETAVNVAREIALITDFCCPVICDPYQEGYFVSQMTHSMANKGSAAKTLYNLLGIKGPLIAAGDDFNDQSMLEIADYKIVMATAPKELHVLADCLAPPSSEAGIITGLQSVFDKIEGAYCGTC